MITHGEWRADGLFVRCGKLVICEVEDNISAIEDNSQEALDNARLIAAAPMLVESLQELVNILVGEGLGELTVVENAREIISSAIKGGEL